MEAKFGLDMDVRSLLGRPSEKISRYWGEMIALASGPGLVLKRINMKEGTNSSMEFHLHKTEMYFIVRGRLRVGVRVGRAENKSVVLGAGDSFYIPPGLPHCRIAETDVELLEVATSDDHGDSILIEDGKTYQHRDN